MTETEKNISTEATWLVSHGSLDSTLIFSTQSPPEGQEIESRPVLLTHPQNSSAPCEITLKFEGSLCEVSSVYVRSTARIFELYTKSEISADNEYVCTARGELAMQNDDPKCVRETIDKDDSCSFGRDKCIGKFTKSSLLSPIENETEPFLNVDDCDRESSSYPSQSDSLIGNTDESLQNLRHDSTTVSEEIAKKGSHSSDEDSWVEVKLSGSLVVDSLGKPGGMSLLHSMGYKDYSEGKAAEKSKISARYSGRKISQDNCIEIVQHEHKYPESVLQHAKEEKLSNIGVSNQLIENNLDNKARADDNLVSFLTNRIAKEALYEADVEIVNAIPCVSLTIRLLSLQDKSRVEINAICIYGLRTDAVKDGTEAISLSSSSLQGSPFGGSLLAMLLPSMLQMPRGSLTKSQDELLCNVRRDMSSLQEGYSESELSRSSHSSILSTPLSVKDIEASKGGNLSSDTSPRKKVSAVVPLFQEKISSYMDKVEENLELTENNLKPNMQNTLPCIGAINDMKGRQNDIGGENSCMGGMVGANENASSPVNGLYNEEFNRQYIPEELESNKIDNCLSKKISGESMLEHLCKRMDRLEALCLRIEDYLHGSFNNMEKRLQLVESCQMLQNYSLMTKRESDTVCSDFPVVSNACFSTSISGQEMLNNGNGKHMSAVDTPNPPCAEVPSSISMPRACLVSSSDCFPLSAIVNPTTLPSDASSMGISKDLDSENTDLSHCNDSSKDGFDKSPNLVLDESASRSLDHQDLVKEEHLGDKDSQSAEHIEVYADSGVSSKPINEHLNSPHKTRPCLEEALASALSAFSVSAHPAQVETTCILTQIPSGSSQIENADDKEGCDHEGLNSSQVETTGICTGIPSYSLKVDNLNEEVCYHDDTSFNMFEGVRYISQENMDSVSYSSSQGSQDAKHTVYRGRNINDAQDGLALTIKQSCKPGTKMVINHEKEIMPLKNENEKKLHDSEMTLAKNVFHTIHANQSASSSLQEANMVHDCLEQLWPIQGLYDFESSNLYPTDQNLVEEKYASLGPLSGNTESHVAGIERIITSLDMEEQVEVTVGSDSSTEAHDKHASRKLHIDSSSLLDVSFTAFNSLQTNMSLESLLCDNTPEQGRENVPLQKTTEVETSNFIEPKRPHGLFFVEDEGLGEFIISGESTLLCSVTAGNTSNQGMVPGVSPGFESLL